MSAVPNLGFYRHFELDIAAAVTDQLGGCLDDMTPVPLSDAEALLHVPNEGGVYQLHHLEAPVYVGKAKSLQSRLRQHASDLDGRQNISRADVSFVCATLSPNWAPFGAEDILMRRASLAWQGSGFGNNDPGEQRDTTTINEGHWDVQFPIRLDWKCAEVKAGTYSAADLLKRVKRSLPFVLRFQRFGQGAHAPPHPAVEAANVTLPTDAMPFWEIMRLIVKALPGWEAVAFPGYAIFYQKGRVYNAHTHVLG